MKKADFIIFSGFLLIYQLSQINSFGQHTLWVYVCKPDRLNSVNGYMQANTPKPGITPTQISTYQQKLYLLTFILGKKTRKKNNKIFIKSHLGSFFLL